MKKRILLLCVFCITLGFTYAQKKGALSHQSKLLFRREAKPFSPLMRQSAHVRSKSFWAMVC